MSIRSSKVCSRAVAELVEELTRRWPNHKKDGAQLGLYTEDIGAMVEEFGLSRMRAAVATARRGRCDFLPEPGELFKLLPAPEIHNAQPLRDPNCPDCSGSGWKMVPSSGRSDKRAARCNCQASRTAPVAATRPTAEQCAAFVEEAMEQLKNMPAPPDPKRQAAELQQQMRQSKFAERVARPVPGPLIPTTAELAEQLAQSAAQREARHHQRPKPDAETVQ